MIEQALPKRIYVATDLSARCDRALARAAHLAKAWQSQLIVAHVVDDTEVARHDSVALGARSWRRPESWAMVLERALKDDLAAAGITAASRIEIGTPADALQQAVARDDAAGLIVLGIAKNELLDRIQLGSTVDALVRHARVPVLNVRGRARAAYQHVVVATDFSEPSMNALRLAARWFEGARLTLFHAYMPPGSASTRDAAAEDAWRAVVTEECAEHLARANLPAHISAGLQSIVERGQPEDLLAEYIASVGVDLVVMGSQGRSGMARALLGSTAENLLHTLDCDTLVVRGE